MKGLLFVFLFAGMATLPAQELIEQAGLFVEAPNRSDTSRHRYSIDNLSYKPGKTFVFNYYCNDGSGNKKKFILKDGESKETPMELGAYDDQSRLKVDRIRLTVTDDLDLFAQEDSTYTFTVAHYDYLSVTDSILASLPSAHITDNRINLMMSPPGYGSFNILYCSPFPFIYVDKHTATWEWRYTMSSFTSRSPSFKARKKRLDFFCNYSFEENELLTTPMGPLICNVVIGTSKSTNTRRAYKTRLKLYYHEDLGFVKLVYKNIDNSEIVFELISQN